MNHDPLADHPVLRFFCTRTSPPDHMNPPDVSIRTLLDRYPQVTGDVACERVTSTAGFSGAAIFRIECRESGFALRRWPAPAPSPRRLRGLHRLLGHIADRGVTQVAVPIRDRESETLIEHGGYWWQVEPWKPGAADFCHNPTPERLRAAMRVLADLHIAAATFRPRMTEAGWFGSAAAAPSPAIRQRWKLLRRWTPDRLRELRRRIETGLPASDSCDPATGQALCDVAGRITAAAVRLADDVERELREAASVQVPLQPCLRDIWHDHVLYTGSEVTGMIDPAACCSESVAADLSRLLGSLVGDDRAAWRTALAEYHLRRPLSEAEERLIPVFDHSGVLLSGLTWLDRLWFRGESIPQLHRVADRLMVIGDRLERRTGSVI